MKTLLRFPLSKKITRNLHLLYTQKTSGRLVLLLGVLLFSGCLFGGKKEPNNVATIPTEVQPVKATASLPPKELEKRKEIQGPIVERQELYDDILSRLSALEKDYQFLKDKISMLEFLAGETSKDTKKTKEEMRVEMEKLRGQLAEYNTLIVRILDRVSKEPKKQETSQVSP